MFQNAVQLYNTDALVSDTDVDRLFRAIEEFIRDYNVADARISRNVKALETDRIEQRIHTRR